MCVGAPPVRTMSRIYASIDGVLLPLEDVKIPLNDYHYGIGVYETLKLRSGRLFFTDDHLDRLFRSAGIIGLKVDVSREDLCGFLEDVVRKNGRDTLNIKIMFIKKDDGSVHSYIYPSTIPQLAGNSNLEYPEAVGVDAMLYRGERQFPQAKSLSMLLSTLALHEAGKHDCWDAILVDSQGELREGSRSSLYWFENDRIYSPAPEKILEGVTRLHFIRSLAKKGVTMHRGSLLLNDVLNRPRPLALSSTSIAIQPVKRLLNDGKWIRLPEEPRIAEFARWFGTYLRDYSLR